MNTVTAPPAAAPLPLPDARPVMLKASLRNADAVDHKSDIGECLASAAHWLGWSLKELAAKLDRDERQVARWLTGAERVQVDVVWSVPELRQPFALHLAKLAGAYVRVCAEFHHAK